MGVALRGSVMRLLSCNWESIHKQRLSCRVWLIHWMSFRVKWRHGLLRDLLLRSNRESCDKKIKQKCMSSLAENCYSWLANVLRRVQLATSVTYGEVMYFN